jgi:ankyrin repeat protein
MNKFFMLCIGLVGMIGTLSGDIQTLLLKTNIKKPDIVLKAAANDREAVKALLKAGVPIDYKDPKLGNKSALLDTAHRGNFEMVTFLLEHKAQVNQTSDEGLTPLMVAVKGHSVPYVDVLGLPSDIRIFSKPATNHLKVVSLLLAQGADINARDKQGRTALIHAAREGDSEMVKLLLEKGADPLIKDNNGDTALSFLEKSQSFGKSFENLSKGDKVKILEAHTTYFNKNPQKTSSIIELLRTYEKRK